MCVLCCVVMFDVLFVVCVRLIVCLMLLLLRVVFGVCVRDVIIVACFGCFSGCKYM